MAPANFDTWLRPTRGVECSAGVLTVGVPTTYGREWLEQRLSPVIRKTLAQVGRPELEVRFQVMSELAGRAGTRRVRGNSYSSATTLFSTQRIDFNPRYTFDDYIV